MNQPCQRPWALRAAMAVFFSGTTAFAAAGEDAAGPWRDVLPDAEMSRAAAASGRLLLKPGRTLRLDTDAFRALIDRAPLEGSLEPSEAILPLPFPDGRFGRFRIEESPVMEPDLATRYPEIRTFRGQGIDDPAATVRFDWTPSGFHALVLSPNGTTLIDPHAKGDTAHYVAYDKRDYRRRTATPFRCLTTGQEVSVAEARDGVVANGSINPTQTIYRLALAATAQYSIAVCGAGPSVSCVLAAMATTLNRVNGIYEAEVGVHLNLAANDDLLVYTDLPTSNAIYTNDDGVAMLAENQANADVVIGSANYDIGHVFSTGGGGIAALGVVCNGSNKARGVTGLSSPVGDSFDVDYVAHEMGHQFGADHSFNGSTGFCNGNRYAPKAYEPGGGSTIMAYAGICGSQDLQLHSDDYFHTASLDEINSHLAGATCNTSGASPNNAPTIVAPGGFTIPKQTPFTLTASSVGDVNGDPVTVDWEEFDLGAASPPDTDAAAVRPIFRSFPPTTSLSRTFPRLSDILGNTATYGESLPTRTRTMVFRATARDNHAGNGGTSFATTSVTVASSGPFAVTAPNTAVTWPSGTTQSVTWSVNGTNANPVACLNVKISLSTDGGQTFPTVLAPSVANNGSATVSVPNVATSHARIKVEAVGNIFFDISNADFTILPGLSVSDVAPVAEGDTGTKTVLFLVSPTQAGAQAITVHYATANGTAAAGSDYLPTSGSLTFAAGSATPQGVSVTVSGDTLYEADETFVLNLSSPVNAVILDGQGQATISNDDAPPTLSIVDVAITEGNAGTKNALFTATLSAVSGASTTVQYSTQDGTAAAGSDYTLASGTLTIPASTASKTIAVPIRGDTVAEADETFFVNLTSPVGATLADGQATGTIVNDDFAGTIQFGATNFTVKEGIPFAMVKVVRTGGLAVGTTVHYATSDGTAVGRYTPTFGDLTFAGGQSSAVVKVPILNDTISEPNQTFLLSLSNPQPTSAGAALGSRTTTVVTITDGDLGGKIQFGAAAYSVSEGAGAVTVIVKRSGGLASPVTVSYAMTDGTATGGGVDYDSTPGTLTFAASGTAATTQTLTVPITADPDAEGAERFTITLSAPSSGALLGSPATTTVTIVDDEATLEFSAAGYTAKETGSAVITVKRSGAATGIATVHYATSDGSAAAGSDYTAASGDLTFATGVTSRTFAVPILKDTLVEGGETVALTLSAPVGASLGGTNPATLTILDDDVTPSVQFSAAAFTVNEATPKAMVTIKRTGSLLGTVTVDCQVAGGTATGGGVDYSDLPVPNTLTFLPGKTLQTCSVPIVNDVVDEGPETLRLSLSTPTWTGNVPAVIGALGTALVTITDNEPTVQFSAAAYSVSEAAKTASIAVKRTGDLTGAATVHYSVTGGSAIGGGVDYTLVNGTLAFAAKQSTRTIPIALVNDVVAEGPQTIDLALDNPLLGGGAGLALGTPSITTVTIKDNDTAGKVQLSAADYSASETGGSVTITVTRTGGTSGGASVDYATADGTATDGVDYTKASGTLVFGVNEKTKTVVIPILDDALVDPGSLFLTFSLGTTTNGLALGTPNTATVWVLKQ